MELRYHGCGHCIRVRSTPHHWEMFPTFYDGEQMADATPITACPRCHASLTIDALQPQPHEPAAVLAAWQHQWPQIQHALEARLRQQIKADPTSYGYHAETALRDFAIALHDVVAVAELIAAQPISAGDDKGG